MACNFINCGYSLRRKNQFKTKYESGFKIRQQQSIQKTLSLFSKILSFDQMIIQVKLLIAKKYNKNVAKYVKRKINLIIWFICTYELII